MKNIFQTAGLYLLLFVAGCATDKPEYQSPWEFNTFTFSVFSMAELSGRLSSLNRQGWQFSSQPLIFQSQDHIHATFFMQRPKAVPLPVPTPMPAPAPAIQQALPPAK